MILVTGATGTVGREVVKQLLEAGAKVRVLARDPARAAALGDVEIVKGDLGAPETLGPAFTGVARAFVLAADEGLARLEGNALDAARKAGVAHVVKLSARGAGYDPSIAIGRWHEEGEKNLKASGLGWTILRPGMFASNALGWAGSIKAQGMVYAPTGEGRTAPIDPRDVAAVAAKALTTPGHEGKLYTLTGPEMLSTAEQVAKIGAAIGKPLRFIDVPPAAAREGMLKAGLSATLADAVLELMALVKAGGGGDATNTVTEVLGRPAGTFDAWVQDHVAAFR